MTLWVFLRSSSDVPGLNDENTVRFLHGDGRIFRDFFDILLLSSIQRVYRVVPIFFDRQRVGLQ